MHFECKPISYTLNYIEVSSMYEADSCKSVISPALDRFCSSLRSFNEADSCEPVITGYCLQCAEINEALQ